jgi:hypothetical protein
MATTNNFTLQNGTFNTGGYALNIGSGATNTGNFTLSGGAFNAGASTITVGGDWSSSVGTFNHNTSTVTLAPATTSTISGNTTFYNLKCVSAGKTINFASGSTQTIEGVFTVTGTEGNLITLGRSGGADPAQWNIIIDTTGSSSVSYASVKNSNATGGKAIAPVNSVDMGNNTNWTWPSPPAPTPSPSPLNGGTVPGGNILYIDPFSGNTGQMMSAASITACPCAIMLPLEAGQVVAAVPIAAPAPAALAAPEHTPSPAETIVPHVVPSFERAGVALDMPLPLSPEAFNNVEPSASLPAPAHFSGANALSVAAPIILPGAFSNAAPAAQMAAPARFDGAIVAPSLTAITPPDAFGGISISMDAPGRADFSLTSAHESSPAILPPDSFNGVQGVFEMQES